MTAECDPQGGTGVAASLPPEDKPCKAVLQGFRGLNIHVELPEVTLPKPRGRPRATKSGKSIMILRVDGEALREAVVRVLELRDKMVYPHYAEKLLDTLAEVLDPLDTALNPEFTRGDDIG